jgi:hypothetical protein
VIVPDTFISQQADEFLAEAYADADERQRDRAVRVLGWISCQSADPRLDWWTIPRLLPARQVRLVGAVVVLAIVTLMAIVAVAVTASIWPFLLTAFMVTVVLMRGLEGRLARKRKPRPLVRRTPRLILPRWVGLQAVLHLGRYTLFTLGVAFGPLLVRMWEAEATKRPRATAVRTYRADRWAALIDGFAFAPTGAALGLVLLAPAHGSAGWTIGLVLFALGGGAYCVFIRSGCYSLLMLTELILATRWHSRVGFMRVLEDAASRGVLRQVGVGYEFTDAGVREHLAALGQAALPSPRPESKAAAWLRKVGRKALRPAEPGKPSHRLAAALVARLTKDRKNRIMFDSGLGAGVATLAAFLLRTIPGPTSLPDEIIGSLFLPLLAVVAGSLVASGLLSLVVAGVGRLARSSVAGLTRPAAIGATAVLVALVALLVVEAGTFLAAVLAYLLPAAFVTASGVWACVLAFRRWHTSRRTWLRIAPDLVAVAASAAALLVVADRAVLTTQWASVLLFPVATGGSLKLWTVLRDAKRLLIRAAADITLSLLLGGELVLFLVWLANVLDMPRAEVSSIRTELGSAGTYAGIYDGGHLWAGVYAALTAASLLFALYPTRLKPVIKWVTRLQVTTVAGVAQRAVTGLYIGLLAIVLVGAVGPTALTPVLQRQLRETYTVALQRQLQAQAELAAYNEISAEINELTPPSSISVLVSLVAGIHQEAGSHSTGSAKHEGALAYQLGQDQAAALDLPSPPSPAADMAADVAADPGDAPTRDAADHGDAPDHGDAADLGDAAAGTGTEESASDQSREHLKVAFELAVTAVANVLPPIPGVTRSEVGQIVGQYLTGLVDDSKVSETFEAWLARIPHSKKPPAGDVLAVPDPGSLSAVAESALAQEASQRGDIFFPDLDPLDVPGAEVETPQQVIGGAVHDADQAQQIQSTGRCTDCISTGDDDGPGSGEHPEPDTHVEGI